MAILRSSIPNLLEQGLHAVFFHAINQYPKIYDKIFNVVDSLKYQENDQQMVGVSAWDPVNESAPTGYEDISQGYENSYTHITFRKGIRASQEVIEDELYGVMKRPTVALARGAYQRCEQDAADVLNNAFSTLAVGNYPRGMSGGYADGVQLINAAHPLKTGGAAQGNTLAANADLSPSSLQEAIKVLESTKDEKGIQLYMPARKLVVPVALKFVAYELVKSEFKPQTSDNEANAFLAQDLTYVVNPFLTSTHSWFLLADQHELMFLWRIRPSFFRANDVDTQDFKCIGRMRYSVGASDWRGITGSA
jgi:phage major head subunit gpT-like protein